MSAVSPRSWRSRDPERGATLVEFAIAFPVLILLMMGIVDFGLNYSNKVQLGNAARAAARAASVANVGNTTDCPINVPGGLTLPTKALICSAKARTHADATKVAVKVLYMGAHGMETTNIPWSKDVNPYSIVVCMSVATYSVTGMLSPFFNGHFQHARAVIKTASPEGHGGAFIPPGQESPLSSGGSADNWAWCTADAPGSE